MKIIREKKQEKEKQHQICHTRKIRFHEQTEKKKQINTKNDSKFDFLLK